MISFMYNTKVKTNSIITHMVKCKEKQELINLQREWLSHKIMATFRSEVEGIFGEELLIVYLLIYTDIHCIIILWNVWILYTLQYVIYVNIKNLKW